MDNSKRGFSLPNYEELTKEQDRLIDWNRQGKKVVIGGPGTGKTTVALIIMKKLQQSDKHRSGLMLMFNQALKNMSAQLTHIDVNTYHRWFKSEYLKRYKEIPPTLKENKWVYIWDKIKGVYLDVNNNTFNKDGFPIKNDDFLFIVDEGQDLPPGLYEFINFHYNHIFITADENQTLGDNNSGIEDIISILKYPEKEIVELSSNFRNTTQIATFANTFFCAAFGKRPMPIGERDGELPILYKYRNNFRNIIARIVNRHKGYPKKLIGILTPKNTIKEKYFKEITTQCQNNNNIYRQGKDINHGKGGIAVINIQETKGLEFDEVFFADINKLYYKANDPDQTRKMLYVVSTRPKDRLFILYDMNSPNQNILNLFPKDGKGFEGNDVLRIISEKE